MRLLMEPGTASLTYIMIIQKPITTPMMKRVSATMFPDMVTCLKFSLANIA